MEMGLKENFFNYVIHCIETLLTLERVCARQEAKLTWYVNCMQQKTSF
jgi:hypothetical protein